MTAVVVFESMFGNTQQIADAVSEGLAQHLRVDQVEVSAASAVVGDWAGAARIGLREWLDTLPKGSSDVAVACFDTRVSRPRLPGSAAAAAEKRLRRLGFRAVARSQSFFVEGTTGPLVRGERGRARRWGEELAVGLGHHGGSADQPTSG